MDYSPDEPEIGIGYYLLVRYTDDWKDTGSVIKKSEKGMTARQMRNLFKKNDIDLKELSLKTDEEKGRIVFHTIPDMIN